MLEWIAAIATKELGTAFFEQVLKLGQASAEDYVKDFFKSSLKDGVANTRLDVAKKAVAEALKAFLLLVEDELLDQDVPPLEIRDRYEQSLLEFVQTDAIKPILGKAFDKECRAIDSTRLATIWQQSTFKQQPFPAMPADFDWPRIGNEYVKKVRRLVRDTPELRSLLETELLEDLVRNTTQLSPGFDVVQYRQSLQSSYGYLKLSTVDTTDQQYRIRLWQMFIEQTVRVALPPMRYELPSDLKRQLQAAGQLAADLSPEALEQYRHEYFQQPARKVLEAVADSRQAVILGDPGSGKSSLLQYLALAWVESQTSEILKPSKVFRLPLLIELREFAINPTANFLEFLHRGRGVDWQFDQQQLHHYLSDHPTLVMFDGLDEVFDRATQATVIDDIIRFSQQYPQAQILVTSRIIGYNPDRLQHSGFQHFTIQSLNTDEIHEFIDRWYDLSMGSDPDKVRLKQRLQDAIANSPAIANLADNPLLLTMMAILNRRQELPRDRADLYDQASRVLLYHWDVDHKRLNLPMDAIGRREKQEMLRAIAYEMQASDAGLKGNLISAERLTFIITNYLREQGFSEPREKANALIQQLRERNFILCYRGADTYGFMHRTFLEYFCAMEIVYRFEKQRTLTFEQLRDEVFGNHWQDETWHEVLRLICGEIDESFIGELVYFLIEIEIDSEEYLTNQTKHANWSVTSSASRYINKMYVFNFLLSADCLLEIRNKVSIKSINDLVLDKLTHISEYAWPYELDYESSYEIMKRVSNLFIDPDEFLYWLKKVIKSNFNQMLKVAAVETLLTEFYRDPETFKFLRDMIYSSDSDWCQREVAIREIFKKYGDNPASINIFKFASQSDEHSFVRMAALEAFIGLSENEAETLKVLKQVSQLDKEYYIRVMALEQLIDKYINLPQIFELISQVVTNDLFERERDESTNPRHVALEALLKEYSTHPKTLELLRDRAINDPDKQLREWAQKQLKMLNEKLKMEE